MKKIILALCLIPVLSFSQDLSKKDKKKILTYATEMCGCVNELMAELHPKTIEVVMLIAEKGQEAAMTDINTMLTAMDSEEVQEFLESFKMMEDASFLERIENCDGSSELPPFLKSQIENGEGEAHDFLMEYLDEDESCEVMKALYDIGTADSKE